MNPAMDPEPFGENGDRTCANLERLSVLRCQAELIGRSDVPNDLRGCGPLLANSGDRRHARHREHDGRVSSHTCRWRSAHDAPDCSERCSASEDDGGERLPRSDERMIR